MALKGPQELPKGAGKDAFEKQQPHIVHPGILPFWEGIDLGKLAAPFNAPFIHWAWEFNARRLREDDRRGHWHSDVFWLAWVIKGHKDLRSVTDGKVALMLVHKALRAGRAATHPLMSSEDTQVQFMQCYELVRFPAGADPVSVALDRADRQRLAPPRDRSPGYLRFVSLAGWLQIGRGKSVIFLPVRTIAAALGRQPNTIVAYRDWGMQDGLLLRVRQGAFSSRPGVSKADEFLFALHHYPQLREHFSCVPSDLDWFAQAFQNAKAHHDSGGAGAH